MGLIGGMARTAVVAGTATAVSNRVSRRQAGRWAAQEQQQPQQYAPPPEPQYAPPPSRSTHLRPTRTPTSPDSSSSVTCAPRAC